MKEYVKNIVPVNGHILGQRINISELEDKTRILNKEKSLNIFYEEKKEIENSYKKSEVFKIFNSKDEDFKNGDIVFVECANIIYLKDNIAFLKKEDIIGKIEDLKDNVNERKD